MPELPEVETIARYLRQGRGTDPPVSGATIADVAIWWARSIAAPAAEEFRSRVIGQTIQTISRRGKFLVVGLNPDWLLIHLRMSGDLVLRQPGEAAAPHDRVTFTFQDQSSLTFNDTRKFGRIWLVADRQDVLGGLGPEPFDQSLTAAEFYRRLRARRRQLKPLLMDQSFLAGLGNIYTDEALHLAGIHPLTLASQLTFRQSEGLLLSIRQVLQAGINRQGASIDWVYRGGDYQKYLRVYGRSGEPCPVCGAPVQRIVVGQRGTHFCARCQPENVEPVDLQGEES